MQSYSAWTENGIMGVNLQTEMCFLIAIPIKLNWDCQCLITSNNLSVGQSS